MTPQRYQKIKQVIEQRQPDLTVVMENVHKAHNLAAIARTCDAVGIPEIHAVTEYEHLSLSQDASSGSGRWVNVITHDTIQAAYSALKTKGFKLLVAHFDERAKDFREIDYTIPTAIVVGQELEGISEEAIAKADATIIIPMHGMVQSLNVSVATALILYEAQKQRLQSGLYNSPKYNLLTSNNLIFEKAYPRVARIYRAKGKTYPTLDHNGQIVK